MEQMHKRFTAEQVKVLLKGYCQGTLDRLAIEEILGSCRECNAHLRAPAALLC